MASGTVTKITKRPLLDNEKELIIKPYKDLQKVMRYISILPLFLFVISIVLGSEFVVWLVFAILTIVLTVLVIGMSIGLFKMRKNISQVLMDGNGIEVQGIALRAQTVGSKQSFVIGPVQLIASQEALGRIQEGATVTVLCVPKLKFAITINNTALMNAVSIKTTTDLEAMSVTTQQVPQPIPVAVQPVHAQAQPQVQKIPDKTSKCPKCAKPVSPEFKACPYCGEILAKPLVCPKCGKEIKPEFKACPYCGENLAKPITCTICSKELKPEFKTCPYCGMDINKMIR